jgi:hypothetical protein
MDIQAFGRAALPRRPFFTYLRWGAVIAGTVVAGATYLLLALLGVAVGLSTVAAGAPGAGRLGTISLATGGWTVLCILVAIYLGGYVAGRVSGLARRADGVIHGFVTWGAMTLLFIWLTTTSLGGLLGGAFGVLGQNVVGLAAPVIDGAELEQRLQSLLDPVERGALDAPARRALVQRLAMADRPGAVELLAGRTGATRERAEAVVDRLLPVVPAVPVADRRQTLEEGLTAASWWLFTALALSLLGGLWGGMVGTRGVSLRAAGDHSAERHLHTSA